MFPFYYLETKKRKHFLKLLLYIGLLKNVSVFLFLWAKNRNFFKRFFKKDRKEKYLSRKGEKI